MKPCLGDYERWITNFQTTKSLITTCTQTRWINCYYNSRATYRAYLSSIWEAFYRHILCQILHLADEFVTTALDKYEPRCLSSTKLSTKICKYRNKISAQSENPNKRDPNQRANLTFTRSPSNQGQFDPPALHSNSDCRIAHELVHQIGEVTVWVHQLSCWTNIAVGDLSHATEKAILEDPVGLVHPIG